MKKVKKTVVASEPPKNLPDGRVDDVFPVNNLTHAPWNPRTPEEMKPDHAEMVKLVESVRALGVVQPVAVWDSDEFTYCIAGNRRLEAAKIVGLKSVPAIVYTDIDEVTARAITRVENAVRFDVSPFLDAKLIGDMLNKGYTQKEIGAVSGMDKSKISRRVKLLQLSPETVKFFSGKRYEVTALEFVADKSQGDERRQKDILSALWQAGGPNYVITLQSVRSAWNNITAVIDPNSWVFTGAEGEARKAKCVACALCTGNQPDLFGDVPGEDKTNRCTNTKCWKKMQAKAKQERLVAALVASGGSADDLKHNCKVVNYFPYDVEKKSKKRRSKTKTFAYAEWDQYNHDYVVRWAPDPKEEKKAEAERKAADDAKCAEERKISETADAAIQRVVNWFASLDDEENGGSCAQILERLESLKESGGEELCRNALLSMLSKALALSDIESEYGNESLRRALVDWLNLHHCIPADIDLTPEELHAISVTAPEA